MASRQGACRPGCRRASALSADAELAPHSPLPPRMSHPPSPRGTRAVIKKEFDKKYGPTWHVVVGRNFGSYVTHETKHFIYFYLGQVAILCFKSG